jgi:hypothetical protein
VRKRIYIVVGLVVFVLVAAPGAYLFHAARAVNAPGVTLSTGSLADSPGFSPGKASDDREPTRYGCGIERWAVKTGTDSSARKVNTKHVVGTGIAKLIHLAKPSYLPDYSRIRPIETTVWSLYTRLTAYKEEADSDYHLIIASPSGQTMILEIPSPSCVAESSPFRSRIAGARAAFSRHFSVNSGWHFTRAWISVRGVGFFDHVHNVDGQAANGIELHPVLSILFR